MPVALERIIGPTIDLVDYAPSEAARVAGRPVARIVVLRGAGMEAEAFATGFLVTPRLLMTNWHVLPNKESAVGLGANFDYERVDGGVQIGSFFEIKPDDFYYANDVLDFAIVAIESKSLEGKPSQEFRTIRLIEATGKILKGHPVNIIQHPDGRPKSYAVTDNRLIDVLDDGFLHYTTDTLPGSSGAPAFSQAWELVALHHSGVPEMRDGEIWSRHGTHWDSENMDDNEVNWVANEGARVSAIVAQLAKTRMPTAGQQALLDELLTTTIDPLESVASVSGETDTANIGGTEITTARTSVMGNNVFNFTGPVTIHINSGAEAPQIVAGKAAPAGGKRVIAVEKVIRFDTDYDAKEGYKEDFLGNGALRVPMPKVAANRMAEIFMDHAQPTKPFVLKYHHYSLVMNKKRRLQMWSAVNVDYTEERRDGRSREELGTDKWIPDPRIPLKFQLTDPEFYKPAGQIDRGHIVRREDSAWGDSPDEVEYSNSDTFHWTNCTPQHEAFNQENPDSEKYGMKGIWGEFESYIKKQVAKNEERCCILAGPILKQSNPSADFGFGKFKYPSEFWKVVVVANGEGNNRKLQAYGFILSQSDVVKKFGIEFAPGKFARYQKKLSEISQAAGVEFDSKLLAVDVKK